MIIIYKDSSANAIFIEDANGVQFINSLQAIIQNGHCSIKDLARDIEIVTERPFDDFEDQNGNSYGNNATEVCNALNAIFQSSGTPTTNLPNITSPLTISLVQGQTLNYELTADFGVGYEWDLSLVPGVATVEGNVRKLVGGSSLSSGSYNIPVKAINYNGEDSETIVLTVSTPAFSNTKSVFFRQNDYCDLTANTSNPFYRSGNNTGTAWSVGFWFKTGTSNNQNQTILGFGGDDVNNEGRVQIKFNGNNGSRQRISVFYGTNFNNLEIFSSTGSTTAGVWQHWIVVYDGGTTENGSGGINTSYSRFKIYKNGVLETPTNTNSNYGFSGAISTELFRIGRQPGGGQYMRNCNVDELAMWASDESANASTIYNSGTPFDLNTLTSTPDHWWRMGDGDTFPTLTDSNGSLNATMVNMTSADIVSDVP